MPSALAVAAGALLFPSPANAHPLTGGPVTGPQLATLAGGLALAILGWLMIARGRPRLTRPGYILLLVGMLAFLGGPDLVASISDLGAPTTRVRLVVVTPVDGQIIESHDVPISVRLFEPAGAAWTPVSSLSAGGRIHVAVDGRVVSRAWTPSVVVPVSAGNHTVTVEYVASDNRSFVPRVLVTRRITVRPPDAMQGGIAAGDTTRGAPPAITWREWHWDPLIGTGLALTALGFLWAARRFPPRPPQPVYFWGGMLALAVALLSPIDAGSEYLFTIHMVQHMLLLLVAPALLALAVPATLVGRLYQIPRAARVLHAIWSPLPALLLFNGVLVFWHLPFAYDATLASRWVHMVEHLSFVGAGMVFWGVIVSPTPRLVRASYGLRLGLVVAADLINFLVGFALAFAGRPFYLHYTQVPRLWGLTPLDDLRLGGGVMWVMGQMMYVIPVLILLNVLLRREGAGRASERLSAGR
ncbi:MAG TPA: cytochrome c oxidase assembly protein [bacterium]|nr:cytochrome c oxidase assembly protein [bacterium]